MNTENTTVLEEFILWFLDQKEVPVEMKKKLVGHIRTNGIDHWVEDFLQKSMKYLIHVGQERSHILSRRLESLQADIAAEENLETSYREKVVEERGTKMISLAEKFVKGVMARSRSLEAAEHKTEASEVENLKAAL